LTGVSKRRRVAVPLALVLLMTLGMGVVACSHFALPPGHDVTVESIRVQLSAGASDVDIYWPGVARSAPMVIVAHGFLRHRHHMSGWGQHLASEGFVAVVPDLPTLSDHARNGRFLSDLRMHFIETDAWSDRIDPKRTGLIGFSAGGLSSLLSAADRPGVAIWVGLDPVDRHGLGAAAAPGVQARTVVLTADPSVCNAHGNAGAIVAALARPEHISFSGAVHVDAEWPTSWMAELVCGRSTEPMRREFRRLATDALHSALAVPSRTQAK
jgi:dienelactone hydrolase